MVEKRRRRRHRRRHPLAALRHQVHLAAGQLPAAPAGGRRRRAETILFRDGFLTEASASNIFVVKDGVLLAPPQDNLMLPGITYDVVLELARSGTACRYECATITGGRGARRRRDLADLVDQGSAAVTTLDGKPVGDAASPGPLFRAHVRAGTRTSRRSSVHAARERHGDA